MTIGIFSVRGLEPHWDHLMEKNGLFMASREGCIPAEKFNGRYVGIPVKNRQKTDRQTNISAFPLLKRRVRRTSHLVKYIVRVHPLLKPVTRNPHL